MLFILAIILGVIVGFLFCRLLSMEKVMTLPISLCFILLFMFLTSCAYTKVSDKYLGTEKVQISQYDVISFNDENDTFKYVNDGTIYVDTTVGKEIIEKDNAKPTITEYEIREKFNSHRKLIKFLFFCNDESLVSITETITLPTGTIKKINSN